MRFRDLGRELAATDLQDNDRLAARPRPGRRLFEPRGIADRFGEDRDRPRFVMVDKIVDDIGERQLSLVAGCRDKAGPDILAMRELVEFASSSCWDAMPSAPASP